MTGDTKPQGHALMTETMITNPILPGFNPDPSICRVGEDYFIATSTFEWYPGMQIHHSRDLADWTLVSRPLARADLLDMRGNPDSCGIWAPCLTYADGLFWLIYTDVKRLSGSFKDAPNYLTTAPSITGPWSDRVYLNSSGFDPSLFHAPDGRKYLVNMLWDHRQTGHGDQFAGIVLQEYSVAEKKLIGPVHNIFKGTDRKLTEAPHLYFRDGWYYLMTAEGGTGYDHAVTLARSRDLLGPYEVHPQKHVLTTAFAPDAPLQRCGHADIVDTPAGETYMVHLCSRPITVNGAAGQSEIRRDLPGSDVLQRRSPLGRETGDPENGMARRWLAIPGRRRSAPDNAPDTAAGGYHTGSRSKGTGADRFCARTFADSISMAPQSRARPVVCARGQPGTVAHIWPAVAGKHVRAGLAGKAADGAPLSCSHAHAL